MARPASPRPSPRASPAPKEGKSDKPKKAKKPKASPPLGPVSLGLPLSKPDELTEAQAKQELTNLQKKYGALIVNFNNQQAELAASQKRVRALDADMSSLSKQVGGPADAQAASLHEQLQNSLQARDPSLSWMGHGR